MNILGNEQKALFEKDKNEVGYPEAEKRYYDLYYRLRKENENKFYNKLTLQQKQSFHKILLLTFIIKNKLSGFSYEIIKNNRQSTARPIIFAITHIGKFDVEIMSEAIREHYTLLSGDYEHMQGTINEFFLGLNGVVYLNESVKSDRASAVEKMIDVLLDGGNLMYFPEGNWNLSPNLPVLPCYWGIVNVAKKGNAIIVPIAIEQYDKHFKINIGENIDMRLYGDTVEEKSKAITVLRDCFATLKYEIWETEPLERAEITKSYWRDYVEKRLSEWPGSNENDILATTYKPKGITKNSEAFAHLQKLSVNHHTAFLFNKDLKGQGD